MISIVIRTLNEKIWLGHCLNMLYQQSFKDYEIIIVDNESIDKTLDIAKRHNIRKILSITDYKPGAAINLGIDAALGDYVVILSAHCVPCNKHLLANLVNSIFPESVAGAYGKQEPFVANKYFMPTGYFYQRFGDMKKIQKGIDDDFFHNANSIIKKAIWNDIKFDETADHLEDQIWARAVLKEKHQIVYEPGAVVYHQHNFP